MLEHGYEYPLWEREESFFSANRRRVEGRRSEWTLKEMEEFDEWQRRLAEEEDVFYVKAKT